MDNSQLEILSQPENVVEIEACCETCADTHRMVTEMYQLFEAMKASPMMNMVMPSSPLVLPHFGR